MATLLTIENAHAATPPAWAQDTDGLRFYFENCHGEQWIAQATKEVFRFSGGDAGWKTVTVETPQYSALIAELAAYIGARHASILLGFRNMVLNREECVWLLSVLTAAASAFGEVP